MRFLVREVPLHAKNAPVRVNYRELSMRTVCLFKFGDPPVSCSLGGASSYHPGAPAEGYLKYMNLQPQTGPSLGSREYTYCRFVGSVNSCSQGALGCICPTTTIAVVVALSLHLSCSSLRY